jgi:hypothetical protein
VQAGGTGSSFEERARFGGQNHGHTMATRGTASDPSRGRRSTGVPDPEDVPPAVATTGNSLRSSPSSQRSVVQNQEEISRMSATLKVTHKAIGAEVRRGPYDVVVDGERVGSVEMNHTIEIPIEPGGHTLQVRNGRNSSSTQTFDAAQEEIVAFRCTGKRFLPIFLASFVVPRLALKLVRD